MKRIKDALGQDKTLREAILEVDLNSLQLDTLRMVLEIIPTKEECRLLLAYTGDVSMLDKPEIMLRTLADIPRLEARLKCAAPLTPPPAALA